MDAPLSVDAHPHLVLGALWTTFAAPIGDAPSPAWLIESLSQTPAASPPVSRPDGVKNAVRDLLRHGGYKPAGRGKPASEYLAKAAQAGTLGPINLPVDACNVVSLHSGLPISVVDLERAQAPYRAGLAADDAVYVFNASGQEIKLKGLLCLHDAEGPCGNPVKDSQRTKTHAGTTRTLSVVWGARALDDHTERTVAWYRELLERAGARVESSVSS